MKKKTPTKFVANYQSTVHLFWPCDYFINIEITIFFLLAVILLSRKYITSLFFFRWLACKAIITKGTININQAQFQDETKTHWQQKAPPPQHGEWEGKDEAAEEKEHAWNFLFCFVLFFSKNLEDLFSNIFLWPFLQRRTWRVLFFFLAKYQIK